MVRRRFRVFVFSATVVLFLLYRVAQNSWDDPLQRISPQTPHSLHNGAPAYPAAQPQSGSTAALGLKNGGKGGHDSAREDSKVVAPPREDDRGAQHQDLSGAETGGKHRDKAGADPAKDGQKHVPAKNLQKPVPTKDNQKPVSTKDLDSFLAKDHHEPVPSKDDLPETASAEDRQDSNGDNGDQVDEVMVKPQELLDVHAKNPSRPPSGVSAGDGGPSKVHWKPVEEHFPLPPESIRSLPETPKSIKIPRIQFDFKNEPEPDAANSRRRERRESVKKEIRRAWSGYRSHAWLHDELMPVTGQFRDPFCNWAATLVDSLDTLWLAGLHDEFHEAAHAVKEIDFTWSPQESIPVFETTIRYLGGLLGAIDVSGGLDGDYAFLLDKAVELADILMGVFDTPNRMPILYYRWKPEFASQPHQAGTVGMAELGTLSLEFTRLAQMTQEPRYFDAIDRITDALVELQEAGTAVPGLFPEQLDASGCERSTASAHLATSQKAQEQLTSPDLSRPAVGYSPEKVLTTEKPKDETLSRRDGPAPVNVSEPHPPRQFPLPQVPPFQVQSNSPPFAADGTTSNWECRPQKLIPSGPGAQVFHIGGSQDSAYEYFQKQYLLLGGSQEKYKKLHLDSVKAIDEWLLYRPMIEGDHDIMFAARLTTNGDPQIEMRMSFPVDHLTCFIGGMYAMSGKLFEQEQDLETATRLTDGCVWAYGVTPLGLMPENSHVMPCPTLEKCEFNETLWWIGLDPSIKWREQSIADWEEKWGSKAEEEPEREAEENDAPGSELPQALKDRIGWDQNSPEPGDQDQETQKFKDQGKVQRRSTSQDDDDALEGKPFQLKSVLEANRLPPLPPRVPWSIPSRPISHEDYVKEKIKNNKIPPGFTALDDVRYILRPEAIESVFYMYRITGDPSWQDKGWKMFEATIRATRTHYGHTAINSVFDTLPAAKDQMESFWLAETLKYYYLLFSDPDVASLDEYVFNTEAHPLRRPR
ncbi:Endoplasmic reticulum mannosyl-oligosaccharide 1 [Escovopsis weberi]|uniref:alpha-1,2-Mannosidase n=1 Tax=Escovopsis weberi TaxID=150374 RepID=A0A0M9VS88_ESCWE|nr:Endoplasmic reticulum mannosyl-oligosaccharide 1 [Escovopsis weberi]